MEFVEIVAGFDETLVRAGARVVGFDNARFSLRFSEGAIPTDVPRFPIVYVRPGLIEDDAAVAPDCAGKFLVEARSEHRPFADVGMTDNSDAFRVDLRHLREDGVAVRS